MRMYDGFDRPDKLGEATIHANEANQGEKI
jgi:hypothetical protein